MVKGEQRPLLVVGTPIHGDCTPSWWLRGEQRPLVVVKGEQRPLVVMVGTPIRGESVPWW